MGVYIALLRGVNVGGNVLKMERLRELCCALRCSNVRTYVQSGNVVFESKGSASSMVSSMEKKLVGETRLPVTVIIRTPTELKRALAHNPFLKGTDFDADAKPVRHYVTFLASAPSKSGLKNLGTIKVGNDQFHVAGKDVYLYYSHTSHDSKLSNNAIEKALGMRATTRNWNTVTKLYEMALEQPP